MSAAARFWEDVYRVQTQRLDQLLQKTQQLEAENAELRADKERLEEVVASFYIEVAPLVPRYPVELWENIEPGRCRGTWAEDGSPYYFTVPHQLVPAFFALQRLAGLCEEKHALREFRAAINAARKEAQP